MRAAVGGLMIGVWLAGVAGRATAETETKPPAAAAATPTVHYRDDKVSVDARDVPIASVLEAIARESGAELVGTPRTEGTVTVHLEKVPLKEALERLVGAQNFTLKYQEGGALKAIELRGGQEAAEKPKPEAAAPTAQGNTTPPKWYAFYKTFDGRDPIPLSGDLKRALGRDEAGWDYLGNTAIASSDPHVRSEAMRAIVNALDHDPEMKEQVLATLGAMSDAELAEFARKSALYRAEDLVRNALRTTSDSELRSRARNVLNELRKNPYQGQHIPLH